MAEGSKIRDAKGRIELTLAAVQHPKPTDLAQKQMHRLVVFILSVVDRIGRIPAAAESPTPVLEWARIPISNRTQAYG
jgi:hypothetical protein